MQYLEKLIFFTKIKQGEKQSKILAPKHWLSLTIVSASDFSFTFKCSTMGLSVVKILVEHSLKVQ